MFSCSMAVADDAEIILTSTGSISRPTIVSFFERTRLIGEEAAPQIMSENTVSYLNLLVGRSLDELKGKGFFNHLKAKFTEDECGKVSASVNYCDEQQSFPMTSVLAIFIAHLYNRVSEVIGESIRVSFCLPPNCPLSVKRSFLDACSIADINKDTVTAVHQDDALVACYWRKLAGIRPADRTILEVTIMYRMYMYVRIYAAK